MGGGDGKVVKVVGIAGSSQLQQPPTFSQNFRCPRTLRREFKLCGTNDLSSATYGEKQAKISPIWDVQTLLSPNAGL